MRESLLLHSTNIVVYPNILLFMGLHYFISFAVFVVQFSRCVLNGCLLCNRRLVGTSGFEPPTSRLSGVRSNHLSYAPISSGGDEEDRTPDPLRARQVLSQLSYGPNLIFTFSTISFVKMVGLNGFEPSTSPLSGVRSNQLSYRPIS